MKKIAWLSSRGVEPVNPDDQFRAFNEEDLAPAARAELARMRGEEPPERPKCVDCHLKSECCYLQSYQLDEQ